MSERGVALILVVLVTSFLSAIGLGLMLIVFVDRLAIPNVRGSVAMLYAADAGIELAARDLSQLDDWTPVLAGEVAGTWIDGPPEGVRERPGHTIDLDLLTNRLNCGGAAGCSPGQMDAVSMERPWGANNPRWRLFTYGPFGAMADFARPAECYVAVWVADDGREVDDDPLADAADGEPGAGVVRVRAEAYGSAGLRRVVEAELVRACIPAGDGCQVRTRVQSWQEVHASVP